MKYMETKDCDHYITSLIDVKKQPVTSNNKSIV
jgi:hypothetical protein